MLDIISHEGNGNQNHKIPQMRYFIPVRMVRMWRNYNCPTLLLGCKMVQLTLENGLPVFQMVKQLGPTDPLFPIFKRIKNSI